MKSTRILILLALALVAAPAVFAADFGVRAGRYNDADQEFVGAEVLFNLGAVNFNPNLEYSLEDNVTAGSANLDMTYDIFNISRARPYVGVGVGLTYRDDDVNGTRTHAVGNLIGGVSFNLSFFKPYAQVKYFRAFDNDNKTTDSKDDVALTIGLRF